MPQSPRRVMVGCPDARPPAYQAVVGLARARMLDLFVTSFYYSGEGPLSALGRRAAPARDLVQLVAIGADPPQRDHGFVGGGRL